METYLKYIKALEDKTKLLDNLVENVIKLEKTIVSNAREEQFKQIREHSKRSINTADGLTNFFRGTNTADD